MPTELDLKKIRRESFSHFEQDGLNELMFGVVVLLMTPLVLLLYISKWYFILIVVFSIVAAVLSQTTFYSVRKQIQAPRTGYAKLPEPSQNTRHKIGLYNFYILMMLFLVKGVSGIAELLEELLPAWFGLSLGVWFAYYFIRTGQKFYLLYAAVAIAAGIFSSTAGEDLLQRYLYLTLTTGVFFLAAGAIRLWLFLRRHPRILPETPDDSQQA